MLSPTLSLDIFLAFLAIVVIWKCLSRSTDAPVPPGPRPLPFIDNLRDAPATYQWRTFAEWKERWGDVVSFSLMGQRIVILNSLESAIDLLEKKSTIYSDRQPLPVTGKILKWDQFMGFTQYGHRFREMRRYMHRYIGSRGQLSKVAPLYGLIEEETQQFLVRLLKRPEQFAEHIQDTVGRVILRAAYGYHKTEENDHVFALVDRVMGTFIKLAHPGSFLVDYIPALQCVPEWFPGAAWKRKIAAWSADVEAMIDLPFDFAKDEALRGTAVESSFVGANVGVMKNAVDEHNLKMAAASLYAGGTDTTMASIHSFFLAMTLYPEVRDRAQQEIDCVVGCDRLPSMSDREQLPYVRAVVSEVLRWNPVAPLTFPHRVQEDDMYKGYSIPKGSMVFANIWHILRDPDVYSDPLLFKPERYLPDGGNVPECDPRSAAFGFGRRICPGLNLAEASLFTTIATVLAVFDISKSIENGVEVAPEAVYSSGTISRPLPFKCSIKPRSAKAEALITSLSEGSLSEG